MLTEIINKGNKYFKISKLSFMKCLIIYVLWKIEIYNIGYTILLVRLYRLLIDTTQIPEDRSSGAYLIRVISMIMTKYTPFISKTVI